MASKHIFRCRSIDVNRPLPIYTSEELPEAAEQNVINRTVPPMPTGMKKNEEAEKHLQDILERNGPEDLYIPTPEVLTSNVKTLYQKMYRGGYQPPRQYIKVQPFPPDSEAPSYDMDSEDDEFMGEELIKNKGFEVDALLFEDMIGTLEKKSGHGIVTVHEAKHFLPGEDELIIAIYDYWVDKRMKRRHPLIPVVKSEKQDVGIVQTGNSTALSVSSNPYVAFRRRTEKMLTRKNRKNDEISYEKMLKLRRDLTKALLIIEMVKNRENNKKEQISLALKIFEERFLSGDFEGKVIEEVSAQKTLQRLGVQVTPNRCVESWLKFDYNLVQNQSPEDLSGEDGDVEGISLESNELLEKNPGPFFFKRKANCLYLKNKRHLPFGISRPSKRLVLESQSLEDRAEVMRTESSPDTSDDDYVSDVGREILWSTSGITNLKKHVQKYFRYSFYPSSSRAISRRHVPRVLDLAEDAKTEKFREEKFENPGIREHVTGPREFGGSPKSDDGWYESLSRNIPGDSPL